MIRPQPGKSIATPEDTLPSAAAVALVQGSCAGDSADSAAIGVASGKSEIFANPQASTTLRWYVLLVTVLVYTLSIADRYVVSTVLEPIRLELHLSDSGIAFLTGVSLALFYVSFGIPISLVADRLNRRNIIAVSLIAWSVMTVLFGRATSYGQLLAAALGGGVGEAGGTPAASSIIADYFPCAR